MGCYRGLALVVGALLLPSLGAAAEGRWEVRGGFVRDPEGRAAILRGLNLSGGHKRKPYFDFHLAPDYARVREQWGMNSIRFLLSWAAIEPEPGVIDTAYLDEVARRMDWAHEAGISVILDMHQDVYGEGFASGAGNGSPLWTCPSRYYERFHPINPWFLNTINPNVLACLHRFWYRDTLRDRFAEIWGIVARRLAHHPAILGVDVYNEPIWIISPWFESGRLQPLYVKSIQAVRAHAPHWLAFLEPSATRNMGFPTGLRPFPFANVVYSPHSYDSSAESGKGFDPKKRKKIIKNVAKLAKEAKRLGAALWIGEYGGMPSKPGIVPYMDAQYAAAGAVAAGSMYWHYTRGPEAYAMLNPDGTEVPHLLEVLVRPFPERVAGDPVSWEFDAAARTFKFSYYPDPKISAPTEISIAPRIYPEGYTVSCGGCVTEPSPTGLRVLKAGNGLPVELTIAPRP